MIGNSRGLKATPLDMLHFTQFLMSYQGGAWTRDGIEPGMDKDVNELLNDVEKIVKDQNDYVIVYFTGHGGLHGDTIIEVNPKGELIKEDLNELTGKKYQDIAQSCFPIIHSSCASAKGVHWIIVHIFNLLT